MQRLNLTEARKREGNASMRSQVLDRRLRRQGGRLGFERLESRRVFAGFQDSFESATLDPFWSTDEYSGYVTFPSTAQAHSGTQSVQFNSVPGSIEKQAGIWHKLDAPSYGEVSTWFYDSGADVGSSNYIQLWLHNTVEVPGWNITMGTYDYNFGDGSYYHINMQGVDPSTMQVQRTPGWHQLGARVFPNDVTFTIDGQTVYHGTEDLRFDQIELVMFAPFWRPSFETYFDDFSYTPYETETTHPDLAAVEVELDGEAIQATWSIDGAALADDPVVKLYWSHDDVFDPQVDVEAHQFDTSGMRDPGQYSATTSLQSLGTPQERLLLVVDPERAIHEADETLAGELGANNVSAAATWFVGIDVKPGSRKNPINVDAKGVIPVTLFTTSDFNAAWVDISSIRFAGAAAKKAVFQDVDRDGDLDLVLHFRLEDTDLREMYRDLIEEDERRCGARDRRRAATVTLTGTAHGDDGETFDFVGAEEVELFASR